jgi:hypothetical protein
LINSSAGCYFYLAVSDSHLGQIKVSVMDSLESIDKSKADYEGEPRNHTVELEAYEKGRSKVEEEFIKRDADLSASPITGQKLVFTTNRKFQLN